MNKPDTMAGFGRLILNLWVSGTDGNINNWLWNNSRIVGMKGVSKAMPAWW